MVLKAETEEMHHRVVTEIMARHLEWGVFVTQIRQVTKESLIIIPIKKMELRRLAAYVTLVEFASGTLKNKPKSWKDVFPEVNENIPIFILGKKTHICNWCCWTVGQYVGMFVVT